MHTKAYAINFTIEGYETLTTTNVMQVAEYLRTDYPKVARVINIDGNVIPAIKAALKTEYGINSAPEEVTALANARTMGDLSREDYLQEMKRRGILRNEFSIADNADRIATEMV